MGTFALLTALLLATTISAEYLFTFPKSLEAGRETTFCLSANEIDIPDWRPGQQYNVNITLTLEQLNTGLTIFKFNYGYVLSGVVEADFSSCPAITAPQTAGDYQANVSVSVDFLGNSEMLFADGTKVKVTKPDYITLIQTDKPIYKPGQTVKFRAMTMDYQLKAQTFGFDMISVETPNGLLMMKWEDVNTTTGLVSLEMPLSDEPVLGEWKIKAQFSKGSSQTTFKVEKYVLPKFEVTITPPKYLLPTTTTIQGTICAKYTYGKPVKGQLKLNVCFGNNRNPYHSRNKKTRPCPTILIDIDGCHDFYIPAKSIALNLKKHLNWGDQLKINATVTEEGTGIELHGFSEGPTLSTTVINLAFEDDSNGLYKPGFPYRGRVKVTNPDGSPAPHELIQISSESRWDNYLIGFHYYYPRNRPTQVWRRNFTSDDNGIIHFVITDMDPSIGYLSLNAEAVEFDDRYNTQHYSIKYNKKFIETYRPSAYHSIRRMYSASDSFIYLPDIDETKECGENMDVDVYYTTPAVSTYNFQAMVKAGDRVVHASSHRITFDGISKFDIIAVRPEQVLTKEIRGVPTEEPLPEEEVPVDEALIVPEIYTPLGAEVSPEIDVVPEEKEKKKIGHFKVTVPVTHDMSPDAQVLVYYMRPDGEIIAADVTFNIQKCFKNKVSMDFEQAELTPGSDAKFTLKAKPNSTCFVGMVDKSINLLGGQNQLTPAKVFEKVKQVARPHTWVSYWRENNQYCEKKYPQEENENPEMRRFRYWHMKPLGVDSIQSFRDFNTWVVTNGVLETRPCQKEEPIYYSMPMPMARQRGISGQMAEVPMMARIDKQPNRALDKKEPEPERIRSLFPETWLWDLYEIGDNEEATFTTTIPDTITEWVGNTLCTNPTDGVGVSQLTSVKGFQPFFVSLTMPYAAVRGENMSLPVTVSNYLDKCIRIDVWLEKGEGYLVEGSNGGRAQFCLCGGKLETVKFYITTTIIGEVELLVKALSVADDGMCGNHVITEDYVGVSDGVQRHLLVEAEGVPQERTKSEYMCVSEKDGTEAELEAAMDLPDNLVMDSERAFVSVIGDIMGPTLSNLKNLLRMPYGCGEQNMASWSPNIYVLQYLTNTNQLTKQIEDEAKGYMRVGYQRQMKYRHSDFSYSAFGESSYYGKDKNGSIWLTAFVVKSMAQSSKYIYIDEEDIKKSVNFILDQQEDDGCFPQVGKTFSSYLKGGLKTGENKAGLTAVIMIALIEAANIGDIGESEGFVDAINRGFYCLRKENPANLDTYTLSLYSYVLSFQENTEWKDLVMRVLNSRQKIEKGLVHWERADLKNENSGYFWYRASSAEVEMTAYVALGFLVDGVENIPNAQPIVQWMTKQRNPYGGFSSTQDTVIALQALAMFGNLTYSGDSNVRIDVTNRKVKETRTVTPDNLLLYQSVAVHPKDGKVKVHMAGTGCALVQVSTRYNIDEEKQKPAFHLKYETYQSNQHRKNCKVKALRICAKYERNQPSNMAIIEVKMPTGWEPLTESIEELQKEGIIARYEVDKNYVQLYFDELTRDKTCVVIEAEKTFEVSNTKKAVMRVYDYYETSDSGSITYDLKTDCPEDKKHVPTKEDIPKNNEGLDCSIEQCRVLDPPMRRPIFVPKGCPKCLDSVNEKDFSKAVCDAPRVYKALLGRKGGYSIKLKANFTVRPKSVIDAFVNYEMNKSCVCGLLKSRDQKAMILTIPDTWETMSRYDEIIKLGEETTIVDLGIVFKTADGKKVSVEKKVTSIKRRKKFCMKMERRRRSREQKLLRRRNRLRLRGERGNA